MAIRFDGYKEFGPYRHKAARFVDDADPSFLYYEEDDEQAKRLGAPGADFLNHESSLMPAQTAQVPDRRLAKNDFKQDLDRTFAQPAEEQASDYGPPEASNAPEPEAPKGFEEDLRSTFGAAPPSRTVNLGPADTALGGRAGASEEAPKANPQMRDFNLGGVAWGTPARTVKLSDGGMMPASEQTSTTGPAGLNWTDKDGKPVDMQQHLYEREAGSTAEKKRLADQKNDDATRSIISKERQDLADLQAGWAREDQARQPYTDEQGREYYGVTKAEGTRRRLAYDLEEAKAGRIDPNRLDKQRGVGDTILTAIGLFADAMGSGKDNFGKAMERARDLDVQQQIQAKDKRVSKAQGDFDRFKEETPTDYERGLAMGLSPEGAKEFAKAQYTATQQYFLNRPDWQSMLKSNKLMLDEYNNQLDDQMTKAIDAINKDVQVSTQAASRYAPPVYVTTGGSPKVSEHSILDGGRDTGMEWTTNDQEIKRQYGMADDAGAELQEALHSLEEYGESPRLMDDEVRGKFEADTGRTAALLSKWLGQGAISGNDVSIPAQLGDDPQAKVKYLKAMKGALSSGVRATARSKQRILGRNAAPRGTVEHRKSQSTK